MLWNENNDDYILIDVNDLYKYPGYKIAAHAYIVSRIDNEADKPCLLANLRFDGYIGFPGGFVDKGEDIITGLNRELYEEIHLPPEFAHDNLLFCHVNPKFKFVLFCFLKEFCFERYLEIEKNVFESRDYGTETLGLLRIPLHDRNLLERIMDLRFIGNAKEQMLTIIRSHNYLSSSAQLDGNRHRLKNKDESDYSILLFTMSKRKLFRLHDVGFRILLFLSKSGWFTLPSFGPLDGKEIIAELNKILGDVGLVFDEKNIFELDIDHRKRMIFWVKLSESAMLAVEKQFINENFFSKNLGIVTPPLFTLSNKKWENERGLPVFLTQKLCPVTRKILTNFTKIRQLIHM